MPHDTELKMFESDLRKEERKNEAEENILKRSQQKEIEEAIEKIKEEYKLKFESQERKFKKNIEVVALQYLSFLEQKIDQLSAFLFEGKEVDIELMIITHQFSDFKYIGYFPKKFCPEYNRLQPSIQAKVEIIWQENENKWKEKFSKEYYTYRPWFIFLGDVKPRMFT